MKVPFCHVCDDVECVKTSKYGTAAPSLESTETCCVFLIKAKSENARVFGISTHVKEPQVVKIIQESSATARLIAWVASER